MLYVIYYLSYGCAVYNQVVTAGFNLFSFLPQSHGFLIDGRASRFAIR